MTMTTADVATDDGSMGPRADRPKRRRFTAEYKARILAEYDVATGLEPATRNRRERGRDREIERLRARAEKAEADLAKHKAALDLMGKAHALLETLSESAEPPVTAKRSKK